MGRARQIDFLLNGVRDNSGNPLAAGTVDFYEVGTTTPKDVWTTQLKAVAASNPYTLDAYGRATLYADGLYRIVIKNSGGSTIQDLDNQHYFATDGNTLYCDASGGSSNAYTLTPSPAAGTYDNGDILVWQANHSNSGASTVNVSSLGAKNIRKGDGTAAVASGDIVQSNWYWMVYDTSVDAFILLNPSSSSSTSRWGGTTGGSANAQTITLSPVISSYTTGLRVQFKAGFTNTSIATLNIDGVGATNIRKGNGNVLLAPGDITAGGIYEVVYDGTQFILEDTASFTLFRDLTTTTTVSSTTSETNLFSTTLLGGTIGANRVLRFSGFGDVLNTTGGNVTFTFRIKLGGTTILAPAAFTVGTGQNRAALRIDFEIWNRNSESSQHWYGGLLITDGSTDSTAGTMRVPFTNGSVAGSNASAVDTSTDQTLAITVQMGTSSASAAARLYKSLIEIV